MAQFGMAPVTVQLEAPGALGRLAAMAAEAQGHNNRSTSGPGGWRQKEIFRGLREESSKFSCFLKISYLKNKH